MLVHQFFEKGKSSKLELQMAGLCCNHYNPNCSELMLSSNKIRSFHGIDSLPFNVISNSPDFVIIPARIVKNYFNNENYPQNYHQRLINIMIQDALNGMFNICLPHLGVLRSAQAATCTYTVNVHPYILSEKIIKNLLKMLSSRFTSQ